jgi:hypothetical protein
MRLFISLLLAASFSFAFEPNVGDTVVTTFWDNEPIPLVITKKENVGARSQTGYVIWAKRLDGKDSLKCVDISWVRPYTKTTATPQSRPSPSSIDTTGNSTPSSSSTGASKAGTTGNKDTTGHADVTVKKTGIRADSTSSGR